MTEFGEALERMVNRAADSSRIDSQVRYLLNEVSRWHEWDRSLEGMRIDNVQGRLFLTDRARYKLLNGGKDNPALDDTERREFLWQYERHRHIKVRLVRDWLMYFVELREHEIGNSTRDPVKPWVKGVPLDEQPMPPVEAQNAWEEAKRR